MGEEHFVYYARGNPQGLPAGYYEVIRDTPFSLLKHTRQKYIERVDQTAVSLLRYFETMEHYYLIKDDVVYPLTGRKSLLRALPDQKRALSRWISQQGLRIKGQAEKFYAQSVNYYVSLLKQD